MDQTLLPTEEKRWVLTWDAFVEELRRVSCLAAPMVVVSVTLYLLQVVSVIMAGHLSELSLSGVSMATSFTNVTGFSLLAGFSGGLETLCGQTYGAGQYKKFGSYTYCAIISLIVISIPVSVIWTFMDRLLIAVGDSTGMIFFSSINKFFRFAFPSAVMICLEWWVYELVILLSGLLPDPKLQTSVLSICLATTTLHYYLQYGIGAAGSTRISNELGAGNPQAAQGVVQVVLIMSLVEVVTVSLILFFCRHIFGYAFSSEKRVVDYVDELAPLMCLTIIMEGLQAVLSGQFPIIPDLTVSFLTEIRTSNLD
ncbi:hypothetical protein OIU84_028684 [Salix udensis]|uniref:Uncharacterized protein n=1 Tax=Salix udensis TaxID=889485 RepID=A0AAD6KDD3_9ROSI|nr:hypothetical protein OIU84_028684 [Salix udensis]